MPAAYRRPRRTMGQSLKPCAGMSQSWERSGWITASCSTRCFAMSPLESPTHQSGQPELVEVIVRTREEARRVMAEISPDGSWGNE
jgi:hypothetical protein